MASGRIAEAQEAVATEDTPDLEEFVGYNLKRAYVIIRNDFRLALSEEGFAPRVFSALSLVVQYPRLTQSELARKLGIERSGLVALIDDLEGRGLLRRTSVPGDRRVQALVPTAKGSRVYARARAKVEAHEAAMLADFTPEEKGQLLALLRRIRAREE